MKTNRTDSQPFRLWPRSLASITSTFTGAIICAVLTLLLLAFSGPTAMAGVVDVTHPDNVLGGLAVTPANVAVSHTSGEPLAYLTDNQASDNSGDNNAFYFSAAGPTFPELLAITGFNASLYKVSIYLANDSSRILGDISLKASATQQTSLNAGDYELDLGTFNQAGRTYTDYAGEGRACFDMEVSALRERRASCFQSRGPIQV